MLRKILKWTLLTVGSIAALLLIFYTVVYFKTEARINKVYNVKLQSLSIPSDSLSYVRGKHIAENRGCMGCHGPNLAGGRFFFDSKSPIGVLQTSNLTSGKGGIGYTDADWIRVLRHGLNKENKSVWFMPSHEIAHLSNEELGELISFLKQQPAVDNQIAAHTIKPLGRVLTFFDKFPLLPAEMIDHNAVYADKVDYTISPAYGAYLATTCKSCHGPNMKGAPAHGPSEPPIPDISSTGNAGKWNEADFINALRTGKTPEGKQLTDAMPYKYFTYTDDELKAILLHLKQVQ
jgi:mono/diheme cytochrome c family protein